MTTELHVVESAAGRCGAGSAGRRVGLPLGALATGSGLVVGEPPAGVSASAVTLVDALRNHGVGCLVIDTDATLSGTADLGLERRTADGPTVLQDRVATAVNRGRSVVFELSWERHEPDAGLDAAARALVDAARDADRRWMLVVADLERYVPADYDGDPAGETLGKLAAGGRAREVGLLATLDSPAGVDPALIEACEWRLWHRLSGTNDRAVVRRLVDGEHARAVRDLGDGEALLDAVWRDGTERVAVDRPATADAGADFGTFAGLREDVAEVLERLDRIEAAVGSEASSDEPPNEAPFEAIEGDVSPTAPPDDSRSDSYEAETSSDAGADDALAALAGVGTDDDPEGAEVAESTGSRLAGDGGPDLGSVADELPAFEAGVGGVEPLPTVGADRPAVAVDLESTLSVLDPTVLALLRAYRADGPLEPESAFQHATGREERVRAYANNRRLRRAGLVEHVGRGRYAYALEARVAAGLPEVREEEAAAVASDLEAAFLD